VRTGGAAGVGERGQSTVELALALPLVALVLLLVVQVGLVIRDEVLVTHAAREAVRVAAVSRDGDAPARAAARAGPLLPQRLRVEVRLPLAGQPQAPDGSTKVVEVRVHYRSVTDVPLVGLLLPDLDLEARSVMRDEQR
jgi:hypothetical protein